MNPFWNLSFDVNKTLDGHFRLKIYLRIVVFLTGLSNVSQVQRRKRKKPQSSEKFQRQRKEKSALHHLQNFSPEDISSGWMLTDIPAHRKLNKKCAGWKPSMSVQASVSPKQTIHHLASMKSETQQRCFTSVPGLQASKRQREQYDRGEGKWVDTFCDMCAT